MASKRSSNIRVDGKFADLMKQIAKIRYEKGLARLDQQELSTREMTKLLTRTNGFRISLEELKTKPKRK